MTLAPVDLRSIPDLVIRDRYPWTQPWVSICEHEAQTPLRANAAHDIVAYLRAPASTAGIHYAVDASTIWRGADERFWRTPHNYRPHRWSVGIEHAGYTVEGGYASIAAQSMLAVSAELHAALILEWEAGHPGERFQLKELGVAGVLNCETGFFSHWTATLACRAMGWPEEGHYDGEFYPFDQLCDLVADALRGTDHAAPEAPQEDPDMMTRHAFFLAGSSDRPDGLRAYVIVDPNNGQVNGWHGVQFLVGGQVGVADEALGGELRTVDFVKLNSGLPIQAFEVDEVSGEIVAFGQGGSIFRVTAVAG